MHQQQNHAFEIHQMAHWAAVEQKQLDEARLRKIKSTLDDMSGLVDAFYAEQRKVNADNDLSPAGRQSRLSATAGRFRIAIDALVNAQLKELDAELAEHVSAMERRVIGSGGDDAVTAILKTEARSMAEQIDPLILTTVYHELCRSGADDLTAQALEEGPIFARRLKPEAISEGRAIRAARLEPDRAESVRQLREHRTALEAVANAARREMDVHLSDRVFASV